MFSAVKMIPLSTEYLTLYSKTKERGSELTVLHDTSISRLPCPVLTADERKRLDDFN